MTALVPCLFAALLYGGNVTADLDYKPTKIAPEACQFIAFVTPHHSLILILVSPGIAVTFNANLRVEIDMPKEPGWHRFHYFWGSDQAYIEGEVVAVRRGPVGMY